MRHLPPAPLLLAGACQSFDKGPGDYGLFFDGPPSCARAGVTPGDIGSTFTIEAWARADDALSHALHPVVIWPGAFALWEDAEGVTSFTDASTDEAGATYPVALMDGDVHHVAGVWSEGVSTLFFDGVRVAFNGTAVFAQSPASALYVGCWGDKDHHFEGVIDEVRLSSTARYAADFTLPEGPFEKDDDTVHLWHFDEGEGETSLDEMSRADVELSAVEWVEFQPGA